LSDLTQRISPIRWLVPRGFALTLSLLSFGIPAEAQERQSGQQIYQAACASCHGADGTGMPQTTVGFSDVIPDFTDCSYSSREAAQDWFVVVSKGGPARRFSRRMPAFGHALTSEEIERVVDYVRSICTDASWPRGELNLPRAMDTEKAFPEDETVVSTGYVRQPGASVASAAIIYENRIGAQGQFEVVVPLAMRQLSARKWSGLHVGDIEIALKRVLLHDGARGSILSGGLELIVPTGDVDGGFGDGTLVYGGYLAAAQAFPSDFFLQMQGGAEIPVRRNRRDPEAFGRAVFGKTIFALGGRAFSPMVEVSASRLLGVSGARTEADWIPQMQFALSRRQHILGNIGMRLPWTSTSIRSREFVMYVIWDWFDGGLFDGW
jgi:hypothetical protein